MTVENMTYDFKTKINKVDSEQYSNLQIPQIDWYLNEAQSVYIKLRYKEFEKNQKRIEDLRNLITSSPIIPVFISTGVTGTSLWTVALPSNYSYFVRGTAIASTASCTIPKILKGIVVQHDDLNDALRNPFLSPSFEWEEFLLVFDGIENVNAYFDSDAIVNFVTIYYIKEPARIANPNSFEGGTYNLPDGTVISTNQDCELAEHTHNEIVDLAVLIATGDLDHPNYKIKQQKVLINE